MDTLGPDPTNPVSRSPFTRGAAQGAAPGGGNANEVKDWLVDTGADISAISAANAANFALAPVAGGGIGAGGVVFPAMRGLTMLFQMVNRQGVVTNVSCRRDVVITPGSDIIGNDQLAEVNATVLWDPATRTGRLQERPLPAAPVPKSDSTIFSIDTVPAIFSSLAPGKYSVEVVSEADPTERSPISLPGIEIRSEVDRPLEPPESELDR